jgi:hypothetical protein
VPLGQAELVLGAKDPMVQNQQQVKAGEIASEMPNPTLMMHLEKSKFGADAQIVPGSGRALHGQ